jgi:hypothetical protein
VDRSKTSYFLKKFRPSSRLLLEGSSHTRQELTNSVELLRSRLPQKFGSLLTVEASSEFTLGAQLVGLDERI